MRKIIEYTLVSEPEATAWRGAPTRLNGRILFGGVPPAAGPVRVGHDPAGPGPMKVVFPPQHLRKALILPPRSRQSMGMPGQCPVRTRLGLLVLGIAVIRGWSPCRPSPAGRS